MDDASVAQQYILDGLSCLPSLPEITASYVSAERPLANLARDYLSALLNADRREASRQVMDAIQHGTSVHDIYLHVFHARNTRSGDYGK